MVGTADVDRALEVAGVERPAGESGRFLDPDAIGDDWRAPKVTDSVIHADDTAWVHAEFTNREAHPENPTLRFDLHYDDEAGWRIDEPFGTVDLEPAVMRFFDVNGVKTPVRSDETHTYRLFPGKYQPYPSAPKLLEFQPNKIVVLPTQPQTVQFATSSTSITEAGLQATGAAVEELVDECARQQVGWSPGRPFGFEEDVIADNHRLSEVTDIAWQVIEYPHVAPNELSLVNIDWETGTVRLTGTGIEGNGARVPFTTECPIDFANFGMTVDIDGGMSFHTSPHYSPPSTCGPR